MVHIAPHTALKHAYTPLLTPPWVFRAKHMQLGMFLWLYNMVAENMEIPSPVAGFSTENDLEFMKMVLNQASSISMSRGRVLSNFCTD